MGRCLKLFAGTMAIMMLAACAHDGIIINRRYLLDPTMDPAKTQPLGQSMLHDVVAGYDSSSQASQVSLNGACPTCGG